MNSKKRKKEKKKKKKEKKRKERVRHVVVFDRRELFVIVKDFKKQKGNFNFFSSSTI